jgi:serine/threonine-protein kinase HipA
MLEGLLRIVKIDKDYFSQLIATGNDLVGAVTVKLMEDE